MQYSTIGEDEEFSFLLDEKQVVYLDFDGAETQYNNADLGLNFDVTVKDSNIGSERADEIVSLLNEQYVEKDIVFVTEKPVSGDFSTVYIGVTNDFDACGEFYGIAETIDAGNVNRNDDAFVFMDSSFSNAEIISVIAHETGHIVEGMSHDIATGTLNDYARDKLVSQTTSTCDVVVKRSGGLNPGTAYTIGSYWSSNMPLGVTKVVITITNNGIVEGYGYERCYTNIYASVNNDTYSINANSSISLTFTSNVYISFDRDDYIDLEVAYSKPIYDKYRPNIIVGHNYSYYSGYVRNQVTVTANYYNDTPETDLVISSAALSRTNSDTVRFDPSEKFTYSFTVKNNGDLKAAASTAVVYIDGKKYQEVAIKELGDGASVTHTLQFNASKLGMGTHSIYVVADGYKVITEANESNNTGTTASFVVETAKADLAISNFNVSVSSDSGLVFSNQSMKIQATIQNLSANKASTATTAALYANNKLLKTFTVPLITAGKSFNLSYTLPGNSVAGGTTEFKLVLDPGNKCAEYNEQNNSASVSKEVVKTEGVLALYNNKIIAQQPNLGNFYMGYSHPYDKVHVFSGGMVSAAMIFKQGRIDVSSGGIASLTTVNSNASVRIFSGGLAENTAMFSGASLTVYKGGSATLTSLYNCSFTVSSGGAADRTTLNPGGKLFVQNGGVANNTTANSSGNLIVQSGGVANSTVVNSEGRVDVSSGGVVRNTTIEQAGSLYAFQGGVVNSLTASGNCYVSGGTVNNLTVADGHLKVYSGGTVSNVTINKGGYCNIASGATVGAIKENGGYVLVLDGAKASFVANTISGLVLSGYQSATLHSGTTANSTRIGASGYLYVYGGRANDTVLTGNGNYAGMWIHSGVGKNTMVNEYSYICVDSDGIVNSTTVNSGGNLYISSGGVGNSTTVNSAGRLLISCGGVGNSTTVNSAGRLLISSDGTHEGKLRIESGAVVSAYAGSIVDFTVSKQKTTDDYLINDISRISGSPVYTLTVSETQAGGTYKLAQGAGSFYNTITIGDGNCYFANMTINSSCVVYENNSYTINSSGGNLTLSVTWQGVSSMLPKAQANIVNKTSSDVLVTGTFSGSSVANEYSVDGSAWQMYTAPITVKDNGTVYLRSSDAGGKKYITSYVVNNIDKVKPLITMSASTRNDTKDPVYITASATDAGGLKSFRYSLDAGKSWKTYAGPVAVAKNGWVHFRAIDSYGNVSTEGILIDNIDNSAPVITISTHPGTGYTNSTYTVGAAAKDAGVGMASFTYSLNQGKTWKTYTGGVTFTQNGWIHFRAIDKLGNVNTKGFLVNKIDKTAPEIRVSGNPTAFTRQAVTLTMKALDSESHTKTQLYSLDAGKTWHNYTGAIKVEKNGWVHFRAIDNAGNVSTKGVQITKIDKTGPGITIVGNPSYYTNGIVTLTAVAKDGTSGVKSVSYSLDAGKTWKKYSQGVSVSSNGWVHFRATDNAGNTTTKGVLVNKIDKSVPALAVDIGNVSLAKGSASVYAMAQDGTSGIKTFRYTLDEGKTWNDYSALSNITVKSGGSIYFQAADKAGNKKTTGIQFSTLNKNNPQITITGNTLDWTNRNVIVQASTSDYSGSIKSLRYSLDSGKNWKNYTNAVTLTSNGWVHFRAIDMQGNVTTQGVLVNKIDKTGPTIKIAEHAAKGSVTVSATALDFSSGIKWFQYSLDSGKSWKSYTKGVTLTRNSWVHFRATDHAGNVTTKGILVDSIAPAAQKAAKSYDAIDYNALKNYDTLAASSDALNDPETDVMKGLLA